MLNENAILLVVGVIVACLLSGGSFTMGLLLGRRTRRSETYLTEAHTDALTGLSNRRAFDKCLDALFQACHEEGNSFVLALVDVDHFKAINDSYGHPAGDIVLQRIASTLEGGCGNASMVARHGGDEFAILIVAPVEVAAARFNQLCKRIAGRPIEVGHTTIEVTISVGLSRCNTELSVGAVVRQADKALYLAKKRGRNQVCFDAALTESAPIGHTGNILRPKFENDTRLEMKPPCPAPILTCHLDELESVPEVRDRVKRGAVSIGNFDGVHAGHRELLARVRAAADRVGGPAVVVVLDPHPATVLRPHSAPARLTTIPRRAELMGELGIDALVVCPASLEFLNHTADEFFELLIANRLQAESVVEGPNFFFGRDRGGDINRLRVLCEQSGKSLEIVESRMEEERMVSSSRIREAISAGQIRLANTMLQSTYQISGRVAAGAGRGRSLGFPTANLVEVATLIPGHGVYAAYVTGQGLPRAGLSGEVLARQGSPAQGPAVGPLLAAVHVGPNPTFDDEQRTKVEVHCLDYDGDLYGQTVTVHWLDQLRGVEKFKSAETLAVQIQRDIATVRSLASQIQSR